MSTRCIDEQNAYKNEFARLLRNYVQARDELLTLTTELGCNTPAGQTLGAGVHVYAKRGYLRELFHEMVDDGHIDYVVDMYHPLRRKVFDTLKDASSYLAKHTTGDCRDCIYETGKIGGIDVYSMYFKEEVLKILKEEAAE